jgi:competence protein ComEA
MVRLWLIYVSAAAGLACSASETLVPRASADNNATHDGGAGRAGQLRRQDEPPLPPGSASDGRDPPPVIDKDAPLPLPPDAPLPPPMRPRQVLTGQVNLNTAGIDELVLLPGIGEAKATRIIEWRSRRGPFHRVKDLRRVKGFGKKTLQRLERFLIIAGPTTLRYEWSLPP